VHAAAIATSPTMKSAASPILRASHGRGSNVATSRPPGFAGESASPLPSGRSSPKRNTSPVAAPSIARAKPRAFFASV
jgi:hypothetical protein